jgi:two-component system response regulator WspF
VRAPSAATPPLVAIGASTGGPRAVADVLRALPKPFGGAVLVVQHVSVAFVRGYAEWLAGETGARVALAREGQALRAGDVLVASEERHMTIGADGRIAFTDHGVAGAQSQLHKPSVDELFASLALHGRPGVAVLLTGMGRDGAEGLLRLRNAGWHTIAQDKATSVVWGMPGEAARIGAASELLPVGEIAAAVTRNLR